MTTPNGPALSRATLALIWAAIVLELLSPIPAFLTLGAVWVMLARPPAFLRLVLRLYGRDLPGPSAGEV
jgi:hypothetical protein